MLQVLSVSSCMFENLDMVDGTLKYSKGTRGQGILKARHGNLNANAETDADWVESRQTGNQPLDVVP